VNWPNNRLNSFSILCIIIVYNLIFVLFRALYFETVWDVVQVQLLNRMREESLKGRQVEMERNKEISQLRKEHRLKDTTIKTLEAEKRQKELILKRKQEEVSKNESRAL